MLGSWSRVDANAAYELGSGWQLYGRVENLFDEDYQQVLGYGTPGLSGSVGVRFGLWIRYMVHWVVRFRYLLAAVLLTASPAPALSDAAGQVVSLDYCADQYVVALSGQDRIAALSPDAQTLFIFSGQSRRSCPDLGAGGACLGPAA